MSAVLHPAVPPAPFDLARPPTEAVWPLSVEKYHEMIRAGILTEDDPVELLEGVLVQKMTKNPPHIVANRRLRFALGRLVPSGWFVEAQDPVTTKDSSPEPDVAVVRGDPLTFPSRSPLPEEVSLVVEVADASLRRDRTTKKRIYARASIPIYWIVNLVERQIEVYTDPTGPADAPDYRSRCDYGPADELPVVFDGKENGRLAVRDLLP